MRDVRKVTFVEPVPLLLFFRPLIPALHTGIVSFQNFAELCAEEAPIVPLRSSLLR
jgi:hypothetical protein